MQKPIGIIPKSGAMSKRESVSVEVRPIDNGYITRKTVCGDDNYESTESYSKEKPALDSMTSSNKMREAVGYLNKNK